MKTIDLASLDTVTGGAKKLPKINNNMGELVDIWQEGSILRRIKPSRR